MVERQELYGFDIGDFYNPRINDIQLNNALTELEKETTELLKNWMLTTFYIKFLGEVNRNLDKPEIKKWAEEEMFDDFFNLKHELNVRDTEKLYTLANLLFFLDEALEDNQDPYRLIEIENQLIEKAKDFQLG